MLCVSHCHFQPVEAVFAKMDTLVLERIAKIMSYIKTTAGAQEGEACIAFGQQHGVDLQMGNFLSCNGALALHF